MNWRLVGAILLATWPLSTPAFADVRQDSNLIQFSYQWGRVEQTFTDATVTVTVTNNITNKIGWDGEVIDTYRITLGSQVIEVTEKHDARAYIFEITGTQNLILEGIDNGYWGGFYGPIMQVESIPLTPATLPVSESPTVSPDVSESMPVTESAEPQTQSSESPASGSEVTESQPLPTPSPEPIVQPSPEPLPPPVAPSPEPSQPEPTPTPEPSPEPTASSPTKSPEPEQTQSPTLSEPIPTPTSTQSESQQVVPETTSPVLSTPPIIVPSPQSSEEPSEEPTSPATQAPEVTEETESDSVSSTVQTAITETIGAAIEAVGELVEVFASAGLDMTAEQREEAQDVVVSSIIVSQVASAASVTARKIK